MSGFSLLCASTLVTCCVVACHVVSDGFTQSEEGGSGQVSAGGSAGHGHGGSGGAAGKRVVAEAGKEEAGVGGESGEGGEAGAGGASTAGSSGSAGTGGVGTAGNGGNGGNAGAASECDAVLGCATNCTGLQQATCTVLAATPCEFNQFAGMSRTLTCGERQVVGTTNCGGCGMVEVELFFDGVRCWQGVPECALTELKGKFISPHKP